MSDTIGCILAMTVVPSTELVSSIIAAVKKADPAAERVDAEVFTPAPQFNDEYPALKVLTDALVSLPDCDAKLSEFDAEIVELDTKLRVLRADRNRWRLLAKALREFAGRDGTTGRASASWGTLRSQILGVLADGRPHKSSELHAFAATSSAAMHLRRLVNEGAVTKVGRGSYRLRVSAPAPEPMQPVAVVAERPAPALATGRGAPLAEASVERLTGAAPQARCPICSRFKWAIGLQRGRYVYECDCMHAKEPRRFYNAGDGSDRPKGVA